MKTKLLAFMVLAFAWGGPAAAQMVTAKDPKSVAGALKEAGYEATLGTDGVGDPVITSKHEGSVFKILFYNCADNKDCATVQFHSGYELKNGIALEKINAWNRTQRFGRAYLDGEGDPIIEMDLDLDDGGVSKALFADNFEFWISVLKQFEKHIGWER